MLSTALAIVAVASATYLYVSTKPKSQKTVQTRDVGDFDGGGEFNTRDEMFRVGRGLPISLLMADEVNGVDEVALDEIAAEERATGFTIDPRQPTQWFKSVHPHEELYASIDPDTVDAWQKERRFRLAQEGEYHGLPSYGRGARERQRYLVGGGGAIPNLRAFQADEPQQTATAQLAF